MGFAVIRSGKNVRTAEVSPVFEVTVTDIFQFRGRYFPLLPKWKVAHASQRFPLTSNHRDSYSPKHLVFGKAVKVRHYPVTVSTENWSRDPQPLEAMLPGRRSKFD